MRDRSYSSVRKWLVRIAIVVVAIEVVYLIAANVVLKTGLLLQLVNKKPEKTQITWDSVVTYLPGVAAVTGFELRSQSRRNQVYVRVAEADARISLVKLALKTIHIRGVDASDVDVRFRQRLDRPPKQGQEAREPDDPASVEFWPDIPEWSNPPDPKPEDLYPMKKKKRPWTIKITGAEVTGPISVALNAIRIEGQGSAGGGVTVKPRRTITIHRATLALEPAKITVGPDVITDDLVIDADLRFDTFPAKGAVIADVLRVISGRLTLDGRLGERATLTRVITPGLSITGSGQLAVDLRLRNGEIRSGSELRLESDAVGLRIMDLDATGSAVVSATTAKEGGRHRTTSHIVFDRYRLVDPDDGSVAVEGENLTLDAFWDGLKVADHVPATHAAVDIPASKIHHIDVFNALVPPKVGLSLDSGTGVVDARIEIDEQVAVGTVDVVAEDVALTSRGTPLVGDLEVHANLAEGDLQAKHFDLAGTTILVDEIIDPSLSERKQERLEEWSGEVTFVSGVVTFGRPLEATGRVDLTMSDSRPVLGLLKQLDVGPGWIAMAPNISNIASTVDLDIGPGSLALDNLEMTGDGLEVLGWVHLQDKQADGRLFARFKGVAA
ncbi:MAG: hypothetical protein PVG53_12945, partial [Holophagae bacterium]